MTSHILKKWCRSNNYLQKQVAEGKSRFDMTVSVGIWNSYSDAVWDHRAGCEGVVVVVRVLL